MANKSVGDSSGPTTAWLVCEWVCVDGSVREYMNVRVSVSVWVCMCMKVCVCVCVCVRVRVYVVSVECVSDWVNERFSSA